MESKQKRVGLGPRLRSLRIEKGLTQAQLAEPSYTHAYVSTIESGKRVPSERALGHMAAKLGVDPDEILTGRSRAMIQGLEVDLQRARGEISAGDISQARFRLKKVLKRAQEFELHRLEARAEEVLGSADEQQGRPDAGMKRYDRAIQLYRDDSPTAASFAIAGKVRTLQAIGEAHHAVYVGESYLEQLKRLGMASPSATLRVLSPLVVAYLSAGSQSKAGEAAEECLRLIPGVKDAGILAAAHVNVAAAELAAGHYRDATISLEKAEQLYETLELQHEAGIVHLARGHAEVRKGQLRIARKHLRRAIELLGASGNVIQQANAALELGRVDRLEGRLKEAEGGLRSALEQLPAHNHDRLRAWGERELAQVLVGSDPREAEKHFRASIDVYEQIQEPIELARTYLLVADLRLQHDDISGALEAYRSSSEALEALPDL